LDKNEGDSFDAEYLSECLERVAGKPDSQGKTPLHYAIEFLSSQVSHQSHQNEEWDFVAMCTLAPVLDRAVAVVKILAEACPDAIEMKDAQGKTPMDHVHYRVRGQAQKEIIEHLKRLVKMSKKSLRKCSTHKVQTKNDCVMKSKINLSKRFNNKTSKVEEVSKPASPGQDSTKYEDVELRPEGITRKHGMNANDIVLVNTESVQPKESNEKDDLIIANHLINMIGDCGVDDDKEHNELGDKSLARLQSIIVGKKNWRAMLEEALEQREKELDCHEGKDIFCPPVPEIVVPQSKSEEDDISALTLPSDII